MGSPLNVPTKTVYYRVAVYYCVIQYNVKTRKTITLKELSFHSIMANLNFDIQRWHFHTILTEILKFKIEKTKCQKVAKNGLSNINTAITCVKHVILERIYSLLKLDNQFIVVKRTRVQHQYKSFTDKDLFIRKCMSPSTNTSSCSRKHTMEGILDHLLSFGMQ